MVNWLVVAWSYGPPEPSTWPREFVKVQPTSSKKPAPELVTVMGNAACAPTFSVELDPAHTVGGLAVTEFAVGLGFTPTMVVAGEEEQPFAVATTE